MCLSAANQDLVGITAEKVLRRSGRTAVNSNELFGFGRCCLIDRCGVRGGCCKISFSASSTPRGPAKKAGRSLLVYVGYPQWGIKHSALLWEEGSCDTDTS
jgi:hypothetical protein